MPVTPVGKLQGSTPPPPQTPPSKEASQNNTAKPQQTRRRRRSIRQKYPEKLAEIDGGKIVDTLKTLRAECDITSPNEIYLLLNPVAISQAAEAKFSQRAQRTEGWRNGLILVPIMVTWISLGLAGFAYTQSIDIDPKLIAKPLLLQWAEGFTTLNEVNAWGFHIPTVLGQWHYFTFGDVAILDFMLFIVLLFLTLRAHRIEMQATRDAEELGVWLREECEILSENSYARSIGPGYGGDTPEWAAHVNKSIDNLQEVMRDVTALVDSFGKVLDGDRETVSKALAAVDNLNGIYEDGRKTYEKLNATVPLIADSCQKVADSQSEAVRSLDKIATAVIASSDAVVQLTQPFATVGVAHLAKETYSQLQHIQQQQKQVQDALNQQVAMVGLMQNVTSILTRCLRDVRRFFRRP